MIYLSIQYFEHIENLEGFIELYVSAYTKNKLIDPVQYINVVRIKKVLNVFTLFKFTYQSRGYNKRTFKYY